MHPNCVTTTLDDAQARRGLSIPLCDTAIGQLGGQHIGYTWPNSATGQPLTWLHDTLHSLVERASKNGPAVPRFSLHDLRSTGATWLRNAGVDPLIIKHLMGHSLKTGDVTDSYTKIFEQSMREAVAIFDEKFQPMTGTGAAVVHIGTKR
jgi:integrase